VTGENVEATLAEPLGPAPLKTPRLREVRKPQTMNPTGSATYRCVLGSIEQIEPDAKA
jgi:hypothetical protein